MFAKSLVPKFAISMSPNRKAITMLLPMYCMKRLSASVHSVVLSRNSCITPPSHSVTFSRQIGQWNGDVGDRIIIPSQQVLHKKCLQLVGVSPIMAPNGAFPGPKGSIQMGHSAGGVDSLRKASGLFRTHSRVKEGGAAVLEAPAIASCVLARLVLEFFLVILFSTTREQKLLGRVWFEHAPLP